MEAEALDKRYCPYCMAPAGEDDTCPRCGKALADYVPQPHHLQPGTVLMDRYAVGGVLGEGGFGITYIGLDRRLETRVAVKEYYPRDKVSRDATASAAITCPIGLQGKSYEKGRQRFLREAQIMARMVKQPAIVTVQDFFEANNTAYIVMEYVDGVTLKTMTERRGHIPPGELLPLIEPIFGALATLHKTGLIHRDISPDNIMVEDGRARLLDFGCAREAEGSETLTVTLKHGFAPMEQYSQGGQGPWTDVYALSATIYYCLTGVVPPRAPDRVMGDTLLLPIKLGAALTETEERALLRGMNVMPQGRFQSVRELYDALYNGVFPLEPGPKPDQGPGPEPVIPEPIHEPEPIVPAPKPQPRPRKKTGAIVAVVLALAAIAAAVLWFSRGGGEPAASPAPVPTAEPTPAPTAEPTPKPTPAPGSGQPLDLSAHKNVKTLPAGYYDAGDVAGFMRDGSVGAIALEAGATLDLNGGGEGEYRLAKPLLVKEGATLRANWLRIPNGAALQVDGTLDCRGLITLEGGTTRLSIGQTGALTEQAERCAVFLMDEWTALSVADGALTERLGGHIQIVPRRPADMTSVTSFKELQAAFADETVTAVSIDKSIDIYGEELWGRGKTVWVSVGVTVRRTDVVNRWNDRMGTLCLDEGSVLVNEGTIQGGIKGGAAVYNYGVYNENMGNGTGMALDGRALVLNFGEIDATLRSRMSGEALLVNAGQFCAYDFEQMGAGFVNLGQLTVSVDTNGDGLTVANGAAMYNSGRMTVDEGATAIVSGWLWNDGGQVDISGGLDGAVYNLRGGTVTAAETAWLPELIYGPGAVEAAAQEQDGHVRRTGETDAAKAGAAPAADGQTLLSALAAGGPVLLTGDVELTEPLAVTAPLYVAGSIKAPSAAVSGSMLVLCEGGSLETEELSLGGGAELFLARNASLKVTGSLTVSGSILYGEGGTLALSGAAVLLRNGGCFLPAGAEVTGLDGASVGVYSASWLCMPSGTPLTAAGLALTVEDSHASLPGGVSLTDGSVSVRYTGYYGDSRLLCLGKTNVFEGSSGITVGAEGTDVGSCTLSFDHADTFLRGETQLVNYGFTSFGGWRQESSLTTGDSARITNHGEMYLFGERDLHQPVENYGYIEPKV